MHSFGGARPSVCFCVFTFTGLVTGGGGGLIRCFRAISLAVDGVASRLIRSLWMMAPGPGRCTCRIRTGSAPVAVPPYRSRHISASSRSDRAVWRRGSVWRWSDSCRRWRWTWPMRLDPPDSTVHSNHHPHCVHRHPLLPHAPSFRCRCNRRRAKPVWTRPRSVGATRSGV